MASYIVSMTLCFCLRAVEIKEQIANNTESLCAILSAKGTRDFLFDLYHSDIAFSQVLLHFQN